MKCSNCTRQNLTLDDFYRRRNNPTERTTSYCKTCERERQQVINKRKALAKKDFLYAYFN